MRLVFFNGGPGFNSEPERALLRAKMHEFGILFHGWDEPSCLRGVNKSDLCFAGAVKDALQFTRALTPGPEKFLLAAHSFGPHFLLPVLREMHESVAGVVLIAPTFDMDATERDILGLAVRDFAKDQVRSEELTYLRKHLKDHQAGFDDQRFQALLCALKDPLLFDHYFKNHAVISTYFSYFANEFGIDIDEYYAVRSSMPAPTGTFSLPCLALFGAYDPIIDRSREAPLLLKHFPQAQIQVFEGSAHYPHVEEMENFLAMLRSFVQDLSVAELHF